MKIEVKVDLEDFIERWSEDTIDEYIKDKIKEEVLRAVKSSDKYKEMIRRQTAAVMDKLDI